MCILRYSNKLAGVYGSFNPCDNMELNLTVHGDYLLWLVYGIPTRTNLLGGEGGLFEAL